MCTDLRLRYIHIDLPESVVTTTPHVNFLTCSKMIVKSFDMHMTDDALASFIDNLINGSAPSEEIHNKDGLTTVEIEVPGVKAEDISVEVSDRNVKIFWKREGRRDSKRTYELSRSHDPESVTSTLSNGILSISVAQSKSAVPRKIPVIVAS